jgi:hypothetical protein
VGAVLKEPGKVVRRHVETQGISQFALTNPTIERPKRPKTEAVIVVRTCVNHFVICFSSMGGLNAPFMEVFLNGERCVRHVLPFVPFYLACMVSMGQ